MKGRTSRRAAIGAILAAPLASAPAVAADPHVSREAEARALFRHHRDTEWGWDEPYGSPPDKAADAAHHTLLRFAKEMYALPLPTTLAGLGALALTMALAKEGFTGVDSGDANEPELRTLIEAVLTVAGVALPADFRGLVFDPEDAPCA